MPEQTQQPTPGAMRAAKAIMDYIREAYTWQGGNLTGEAITDGVAVIIDEATGLPELVAAAEGVELLYAEYMTLYPAPGRSHEIACEVMRQARAALAKARREGE